VVAQGKNQDYLQFRERNKQGFYYLDDVAVQECSGCGLYPGKKSAKKKVRRKKSGGIDRGEGGIIQ
jgi:hypothetical protein